MSEYKSIIKKYLLPPSNPLAGFLPINDFLKAGQGFVNYTIRPKSSAQTGDSITAKAGIVFDNNDPIPTNTWVNIIDAVPPTSSMNPLPLQAADSVLLTWTGVDDPGGSGVKEYAIYVSVNGGPFNLYKNGLTDTSIYFKGIGDSLYCFYCIATDNVINIEPLKNGCEAQIRFTNVTLPISWLYFSGQRNASKSLLKWATTSEINSKYFDVERSFDGIHFSKIGQVQSAGTSSSTNNYSFVDGGSIDPAINIVYYRLRQVDQDERFTYSIVVTLRINQVNTDPKISAYPNPFSQHIMLKVITVAASDQTDNVTLYSMEGRILYQKKVQNRGSSTILLDDLPELVQGIYLLKISINGKMYTIKMVKK